MGRLMSRLGSRAYRASGIPANSWYFTLIFLRTRYSSTSSIYRSIPILVRATCTSTTRPVRVYVFVCSIFTPVLLYCCYRRASTWTWINMYQLHPEECSQYITRSQNARINGLALLSVYCTTAPTGAMVPVLVRVVAAYAKNTHALQRVNIISRSGQRRVGGLSPKPPKSLTARCLPLRSTQDIRTQIRGGGGGSASVWEMGEVTTSSASRPPTLDSRQYLKNGHHQIRYQVRVAGQNMIISTYISILFHTLILFLIACSSDGDEEIEAYHVTPRSVGYGLPLVMFWFRVWLDSIFRVFQFRANLRVNLTCELSPM